MDLLPWEALVISIHAPLTGSDYLLFVPRLWREISIHAPLTGSDQPAENSDTAAQISIHAPLTGSDS